MPTDLTGAAGSAVAGASALGGGGTDPLAQLTALISQITQMMSSLGGSAVAGGGGARS